MMDDRVAAQLERMAAALELLAAEAVAGRAEREAQAESERAAVLARWEGLMDRARLAGLRWQAVDRKQCRPGYRFADEAERARDCETVERCEREEAEAMAGAEELEAAHPWLADRRRAVEAAVAAGVAGDD